MKKFTLSFLTALTLLSVFPAPANAGSTPTPSSRNETNPAAEAQAQALLARLDEIKNMDIKNMSTTDKKQLRQEVKAIKSNLKDTMGGVYLSIGAIIIILLLLILLL